MSGFEQCVLEAPFAASSRFGDGEAVEGVEGERGVAGRTESDQVVVALDRRVSVDGGEASRSARRRTGVNWSSTATSARLAATATGTP